MTRLVPVMSSVLLAILVGCGSRTPGGPKGKGSRQPAKTASPSKGGNRLVGTWEFVRSSTNQRPDWGTNLEFLSDGKVILRAVGYRNEGTYALEKNVLKIRAAPLDEKLTVKKLTDRDLVLEIPLPVTHPPLFEYRRK